ncbi:hypothetical protein JTB14_003513 [Gonioctena quinquepunctata]|nr:hypothetical protein JTB14_003513 [Gonioctena quinquepunctata]
MEGHQYMKTDWQNETQLDSNDEENETKFEPVEKWELNLDDKPTQPEGENDCETHVIKCETLKEESSDREYKTHKQLNDLNSDIKVPEILMVSNIPDSKPCFSVKTETDLEEDSTFDIPKTPTGRGYPIEVKNETKLKKSKLASILINGSQHFPIIMIGKQLCLLFRNISIENNVRSARPFFTSILNSREVVDRKEMLRSVPARDEGAIGEKSIDVDAIIHKHSDTFPTIDTPNKLFKGMPFKNLPIFNIRVSPNNTIINLTDAKGTPKLTRSCGVEGFKNTRKGTNVAAQATAITIGTKALEQGVKTVRIRVRGLGPGRMAAIKGLQLSGLDIVSITDSTRVSWNPPRPRKQRKL